MSLAVPILQFSKKKVWFKQGPAIPSMYPDYRNLLVRVSQILAKLGFRKILA